MANRRFSMSRLISEALASSFRYRDTGALHVIDAELGAGVHAEIKLRQVAVKVLLVDVLEHADESALEDAEEAFKSVGMHIAPRLLVLGMVNGFVLQDLALVHGRAVSHQAAVLMQMLNQRIPHVLVIEVHAADIPAALDEAEYLGRRTCVQGQPCGLAGLGRLRKVSLVGFHGHACAAQLASIRRGHCMANPVAHEPRGFHPHAQGALKLAGADAFLGRAHQVDRLKPIAQRRMAVLEDGPHLHGEGLTALVALPEANTSGLAVEAADLLLVAVPAVRADGAGGPKMPLYVLVGGGFIGELGGLKDRGHEAFSGMGKAYL
jgi:hypothetical protein